MDTSPEAQWLVERMSLTGYVVISISASFGGQRATWSYIFHDNPNQGGGVLCWWWCILAEVEGKREVGSNDKGIKTVNTIRQS